MSDVAIIDNGGANIASLRFALERLGATSHLTADPGELRAARRVILPGVGAAADAMARLRALRLDELIPRLTQPVLGICLGMQLFAATSEEGQLPGLGWIRAETRRFRYEGMEPLRVPHMGWNTLRVAAPHPLFEGLDEEPRFYFVHSYHLACQDADDVVGVTHYGYDFPAVVARGNIMGTQFHPEKSHRFGMQLLKNFATRL